MQTLAQENPIAVNASDLASSGRVDVIRVLHVDDDPCVLSVSKDILMMEGNFEIDGASCVDEAFRKLERQTYDVIISDYEMPQEDGLQFLKELRDRKKTIPFVLFTGKGREEVAIKALNLGADGYYNKQGSTETVYGELAHGIRFAVARKKAEEAVSQQYAVTQGILESVNEGIFSLDTNYCHTSFNKRHAEVMKMLYGVNVEIGGNLLDYQTNPSDRKIAKENIDRALKGEFVVDTKESGDKKLGRRWLEVRHCPVRNQKSEVIGVAIFSKDITESRTVELKIAESEEKFRKAFEMGPDAFAISTLEESTIIDANERFLEMFGYTREEVVGNHASELGIWATPSDRKKMADLLKSEGKAINLELLYKRKNGEVFPVVFSASLLRANDQALVLIACRDVFKQKQSEEALKQSEANYRKLINGMDDTVWVIDFDKNFIDVNEAASNALGYSKEELLRSGLDGIDKHLTAERGKILLDKLVSNGKDVFETVHTAKDGREIPVEICSTLITYNGEQAVLSIARNITERKKAEKALNENQRKLNQVFAASPDAITVVDINGKITDCNETALSLGGFSSKSELIGKNAFSLIAEKDRHRAMENFKKAVKDGVVRNAEYSLLTKDGSEYAAESSASVIKDESGKLVGFVAIAKDITERKKSEQKFVDLARFPSEDPNPVMRIAKDSSILYANDAAKLLLRNLKVDVGQHSLPQIKRIVAGVLTSGLRKNVEVNHGNRTFLFTFAPIPGANYVNVYALDITKRKKAEEQLKEDHVKLKEMNEKLNVVGSLTRHDVRNKLSVIVANTFLLKKQVGNNPQILKNLQAIDLAVNQSKRLLEFVSLYEKIGIEKPAKIEVAASFDQAANLISHNGAEIINKAQGLTVLADTMLSQLLYNLIDNSLKHGETVKQIRLSYMQNEKETKLFYEDNGVGIPQENKEKIFSEGFTTGGSGLGLKLVKKMIEVYGWGITEEGEPGKGAKFVMTIPNILKNPQR